MDALRMPIYETAEIAHLAGVKPARARRWLQGYHYVAGPSGVKKQQRSVIRRRVERSAHASFLDLVELLSVKRMLDKGISLQKIRRAADEAYGVLGVEYPFARKKVLMAGQRLYVELRNKEAGNLLELLTEGQLAIAQIIRDVAEQLTFIEDLAAEWWPMGKAVPVVVDPRRSFGAPSTATKAIKTANVFDLYRAEQEDVQAVARWLQIPADEVEAAVRFEAEQLKKAA